MTTKAICPNCRFRGRISDELAKAHTIVCPRCKAATTIDQLRRGMSARSLDDATFPIFVEPAPDMGPVDSVASAVPVPLGLGDPATRRGLRAVSVPEPIAPAPTPVPPPATAPALIPAPVAVPVPAPEPAARAPQPAASVAPVTEAEAYTGDFMKDEAGRFAQYVAARLGELHKKRAQLTDAENRFELMTMEQKQEVFRAKAANAAEAARLKERERALAEREAALAAREADAAARDARAAASASRVAETDRRAAELRAAIEQLDARRQALADEREALNRRAEALDRTELAQHRRAAELDDLDERLRAEQEAFERERDAARAG